MNLSTEATIILRPPTATRLSSPAAFEDPLLKFLSRKWHVNLSTLAVQKGRRNVTVELKLVPGSDNTAVKQLQDSLVYQNLQDTKIHTEERISHPSDLRSVEGQDVCVHFAREQRGVLLFTSRTEWEVLAWGVEGKLESWMRETEWGIEDTSGEVRGDWRNRYAVVYSGATEPGKQDSAIEVWSFFPSGLKPETLEKIRSALAALKNTDVRQLAAQLGEVKRDDSRYKIETENRNKPGRESGISEWLR